MDRTKVLYGPRTQTYGETNYLDEKIEFWTESRYWETNYLDEKIEFWTESRYCMVLGPYNIRTWGNQPLSGNLGTKQDLAATRDI